MLDPLRFLAAGSLLLLSSRPAYQQLRASLRQPRRAQERILADLLRRNAGSRYGRRWKFAGIQNVRQYQDTVPLVTYDQLQPWIEAIKQGEKAVLTEEPVLMMEKTSGSTAASKYIPYTASLRREFQRAISAWLHDLYRHRPGLLTGGGYWSVSPAVGMTEVTPGGLPVGYEEDTEYFGRLEQWILKQLLLIPQGVCRIPDMETNRYVTLRFLLESESLRFISVWNPSFLSLLWAFLGKYAAQLIADIRSGELTPPAPLPASFHRRLVAGLVPRPRRAQKLAALLENGATCSARDIWPGLQLISCWTSAASARFVPAMAADFPEVEIQGKGLLATEGVVSIPLWGHAGAALCVTSHFYEFADPDHPTDRPRLADELEMGKNYFVIISTGGGLYRYTLQDGVRVVGMVEKTPLLEFIGKTGQVSDLCGEKLSEARVGGVLESALVSFDLGRSFVMMAPEWGEPPFYVVFLEAPALDDEEFKSFVRGVETGLMEGHHYAYCRRLGQLGELRGVRIERTAVAEFLDHVSGRGQRMGDIKHAYLHPECGWTERLRGLAVPEGR